MTADLLLELFQHSLLSARSDVVGTVLLRVLGPAPFGLLIRLGPGNVEVRRSEVREADLVVYCDQQQLDELLLSGYTTRAMRVHGNEGLLHTLTALLRPAEDRLSLRFR